MLNDIIVAKFGGTSLAGAEQFRRVRDIITKDPRRRYIVVSAPGKRCASDEKVTDLLYRAARERAYPYAVEERFADIARDLGIAYPVHEEWQAFFRMFLACGDTDFLVSRGEYMCAALLSAYLGCRMVDAKDALPLTAAGDVGRDAYPAMRAALQNIHRAVIPGFYGCGPGGKVTLLSRGGSDITGAVVARALHACLYENWTDVSGFYEADPRRLPQAKPVAHITYQEMRQLSHLGATVLHEDAVFPVLEEGIPIRICNTNQPEAAGTRITGHRAQGGGTCAVTGKGGYRIRVMSREELKDWGDRQPQRCEHILPCGDKNCVFVNAETAADGEGSALAILAVVGEWKGETAPLNALCAALQERRIPLLFLDGGISDGALFIGVPEEQGDAALSVLYHLFCEKETGHS